MNRPTDLAAIAGLALAMMLCGALGGAMVIVSLVAGNYWLLVPTAIPFACTALLGYRLKQAS